MTQIFRIAPLLIRFAPSLRRILGSAMPGAAASGQQAGVSRVSTATIDMTLDQSSGEIDGLVKMGPYVGKQLSQLNLSELKSVYTYCQQNDMEALRLIQTYASRARPDEWSEPDNSDSGSSRQPTSDTVMTVDEARQILGLETSARKQDIVQAHRSLMSRLHPDKGGSNYLAAKINAAKQCLLDAL
ncbi:molecular chaperone DnaJ [Granulosicoccus antarcticus]|nr:molecular chaperone DnaJ [Granulosicoccus antarcticus]